MARGKLTDPQQKAKLSLLTIFVVYLAPSGRGVHVFLLFLNKTTGKQTQEGERKITLLEMLPACEEGKGGATLDLQLKQQIMAAHYC